MRLTFFGMACYIAGMTQQLCQSHPELFYSPDLEPDPEVWSSADSDTKRELAVKQLERERECIKVCVECPVMMECRQWVKDIGLPVYGVVGGLTKYDRGQRTLTDLYIANHLDPRRKNAKRS